MYPNIKYGDRVMVARQAIRITSAFITKTHLGKDDKPIAYDIEVPIAAQGNETGERFHSGLQWERLHNISADLIEPWEHNDWLHGAPDPVPNLEHIKRDILDNWPDAPPAKEEK